MPVRSLWPVGCGTSFTGLQQVADWVAPSMAVSFQAKSTLVYQDRVQRSLRFLLNEAAYVNPTLLGRWIEG